MRKHLQLIGILLAIGTLLFAQGTTQVAVKVTKDGKVLKDTTYNFNDAKEAKQAVHMMDAMASDELDFFFNEEDGHKEIHMESHGDKMANKMVFISEDGEETVQNLDGGNVKWVTASDSEDGESKVIIMKMDGDKNVHKHVYITSGEDDMDENVKVIVKDLQDGDCGDGVKKEIKKEVIIVTDGEGDEKGEWTIKELDKNENIEVIVIKKGKDNNEDVEVEVKKIIKEEQKMKEEKETKKKNKR